MKISIRKMTRIGSCLCCLMVVSGQAQIPSYVPKDSLTAWWGLDGTFKSSNSEIRHEEYCNSKLNFYGYYSDCDYKSLSFNDSSRFMNVTDMNKGTLKGATFSLSFWISFANLRLPVNSSDSVKNVVGWRPMLKIIRMRNFDEGILLLQGKTDLRADTLKIKPYQNYHIVIIDQNGKSLMYVNGKYIGESQQYGSQATGDSSLYFGNYGCWQSKSFNGQLDNIGLWHKALSAQEIAELYNGGKCDFRIVEEIKRASVMGDSAFFTIKTNKKVKSYTWKYLNPKTYQFENISDSSIFSGYHTDTLKLKSINSEWENVYFRCFVQGEDCGCLFSDTARLDFSANDEFPIAPYSNNDLKVFPNPLKSNLLHIKSKIPLIKLNIYNTLGELILQSESADNEYLDLKGIPSGNYILKAHDQYHQVYHQWIAIEQE